MLIAHQLAMRLLSCMASMCSQAATVLWLWSGWTLRSSDLLVSSRCTVDCKLPPACALAQPSMCAWCVCAALRFHNGTDISVSWALAWMILTYLLSADLLPSLYVLQPHHQ